MTDVFLRAEHFGGVWYCDYYENNLASRIGRRRQVRSDAALKAMIHRTARDKGSAGLRIVEHDIDRGRVDVWLLLTREQLDKLTA